MKLSSLYNIIKKYKNYTEKERFFEENGYYFRGNKMTSIDTIRHKITFEDGSYHFYAPDDYHDVLLKEEAQEDKTSLSSKPNFRLHQTCWACPEQYDVFLGEKQVGYLRLRYGMFRCEYPDVGGEIIYTNTECGDGTFDDDETRERCLEAAVAAIAKKLNISDYSFTIEYL